MTIRRSPSQEALHNGSGKPSLYARLLKRPLDVAVVLAALPIVAPAAAVISLAILATSRGPVLLRVTRKGRDGKIFRQLRFRCVDMDALNAAPGTKLPATASGRDPRVTPIGDFLLRTRLNSLPQIVNVLAGEMSLIGPLPEPVRADRQIERNATLRRVAPGIFCPSELPAYSHLSGKDRKAVAIAYATKVTFAMDVKVALNALTCSLFPGQPKTG